MRTNDHLGDVLAQLHAGIQRRLRPTPLLADPNRRRVYDRLLALNPRTLSRAPVAQTRFVVIDTETTGLNAYAGNEILSIALIEWQGRYGGNRSPMISSIFLRYTVCIWWV